MKGGAVTVDRIERALRLVAYLVARDDEGEVYLPILDRLEQELQLLRVAESPRERARRLLQAGAVNVADVSRIDRPNSNLPGPHGRLS